VRRSLANGYINQQRRASRREYAYEDVPERPGHRHLFAAVASHG